MTNYQYRRAMRVLDHAIEHLGPSRACSLLIQDGRIIGYLPHNQKEETRAILADAMVRLVMEDSI